MSEVPNLQSELSRVFRQAGEFSLSTGQMVSAGKCDPSRQATAWTAERLEREQVIERLTSADRDLRGRVDITPEVVAALALRVTELLRDFPKRLDEQQQHRLKMALLACERAMKIIRSDVNSWLHQCRG